MPINKVVFGQDTLLDLTGDTVSPVSLLAGITAHDAAGNAIVGELVASGARVTTGEFTTSSATSGTFTIPGVQLAEELGGTWGDIKDRVNFMMYNSGPIATNISALSAYTLLGGAVFALPLASKPSSDTVGVELTVNSQRRNTAAGTGAVKITNAGVVITYSTYARVSAGQQFKWIVWM